MNKLNLCSSLENPPIQMTTDGALLVEGIENWIQSLLPVEDIKDFYDATPVLRMSDPKTGAVFLVKRLK